MMQNNIPTVLEGIVSARRRHLPDIRQRISHVDPAVLPRSQRSLFHALGGGDPQGRINQNRYIMECKSASPSLGLIRKNYSPGEIARVYSRYASAISVLCEPEKFGGDYDHLATVAASTHLPVLCKDFIIDPVQLHAARYFGADAVLLMLSVLEDQEYRELAAEADRLGLDVLTEVIDEDEVSRGTSLGAKIFGVNHRNLHDLSIDLSRSSRLARHIPPDAVLVSESGIQDHHTIRKLGGHSHAFLVGSQLTSQPDIDRAARSLVFGTHKVCGLQTPSAAQVARACGAIYGGLIFEPSSPRNVSRETAEKIISAEPGLEYVAVSRRESRWSELTFDGISVLQLHTPLHRSVAEELEFLNRVREDVGPHIRLWRAISMTEPHSADIARELSRCQDIELLVLDSQHGGSGQTFNWSSIPQEILAKSLLAGGINEDNLTAALAVGSAGIDINSGVEYPVSSGTWAHHKDAAALHRIFSIIHNDFEAKDDN
ncbi:bifunctional indole-3-glycerol-phosphate synthase TrpC/phosphoribosylanthranilate isomerase TrpF [Corynebacterium poyangense]|nr:bifunctional indole-3-glycerol-phosphate synthase TrpC/phosphoribosylanthranilate isomerase TrpF [Corynebacterium poyangense]